MSTRSTDSAPKLHGIWGHDACLVRLRYMAQEDADLDGIWAAGSARERCDEYADLVRFVLDGILPADGKIDRSEDTNA